MAKDDYYVIVYRILAYLYVQLKHGEQIDPEMLKHDGALFSVPESYWLYIMEHMISQGFIEGLSVQKSWGGTAVVLGWDRCRITPEGIGYLCDNSLMEKAKQFLKDIKEITPFL